MKYLSVATLVAFSCFLFSACSNDADLTPYENKIAQLQTTLDSLTNGSGGGSSITLSPELQGKDALLNSQIEALKKDLKDIEDKHKSDINAKESEIAGLDELLAKIDGGSIADIKEALKKLQQDKEQQIKEQEANLAKLESDKQKLEQNLLDATDNETKWNNLLLLESNKTYAQQKGLPSIGLVSVTLSREEKEVVEKEEGSEENPSEEVDTFVPYTTYEFIYDNGTEIRMNFYDHLGGGECTYYTPTYPTDCSYDDNRLIRIANNSDISWFRHNISKKARLNKWNYYSLNLVSEKKEYLDERRILYSGDKKEYQSYSQNLSYDGLLLENGSRAVPNDDVNPETPDTIEELFYKGLAGTNLPEYYARNEIKIYVEKKFSQDGSQSFLERTVKEEYYTPDNNKEFVLNIEDQNPACKEYTVGTGDYGYWRDTGKPCYYK